MEKVLRKDIDTKKVKQTILKYSKDISTIGDRHRGVFSIKNIRIYDIDNTFKKVEVDVEFKGEIFAQISSLKGDEWYDSSILENERYRVSKIRLNKFFRKRMFNDINSRLSYFGEKINYEDSIKKLKWI